MEALYGTFLDRVAEGRGLPRDQVESVAGGRVWSGRRALDRGLVDAIGGPLESLGVTRRLAGLGDDEPVLIDLHPRRPRLSGLALLRGLGGERA